MDLILTEVNDMILDQTNEHLPSFCKHAIIDVTTDFFVSGHQTTCSLNVTGQVRPQSKLIWSALKIT